MKWDNKLLIDYKENGFALARKVFSQNDIDTIKFAIDEVELFAKQFHSSFRHKNQLYIIQQDEKIGRNLRFAQWPSYTWPTLEKYRTDQRILELVKPFLGNNLKQIINQIVWKHPNAAHTSYGFHQDARFRRPASAYTDLANSFVQTAIAIDPHTEENGCLLMIPGSHKLGDIDFYNKTSVIEEQPDFSSLRKLFPALKTPQAVILEPGDVAIWHPYTLHGSGQNTSKINRRTYLNGYVNAANCSLGEWAFKDGKPQQLGEPVLVQYESLYTKPEPHYISGHPFPVKSKY